MGPLEWLVSDGWSVAIHTTPSGVRAAASHPRGGLNAYAQRADVGEALAELERDARRLLGLAKAEHVADCRAHGVEVA